MRRSPLLSAIVVLILVPVARLLAADVTGEVRIFDRDGNRADRSAVAIWLEGIPRNPDRALPQGLSMSSRNKAFTPRVLLVPRGAEVEFPNSDPIFHNVFSVSRPKRFDLGLYKSGQSRSVRFDEVGLVRVYCNIHSTMVGFVRVVDSDHTVVTGPDGAFRLEDVPPGRWVLHAWEEQAGEMSKPVVVDGPEVRFELDLDASGFEEKPHLNKYGRPYKKRTQDERY